MNIELNTCKKIIMNTFIRRGMTKNGSNFILQDDLFYICFELQKSKIRNGYFLNVGICATYLLPEGATPCKSDEWHAIGRFDEIMKLINRNTHEYLLCTEEYSATQFYDDFDKLFHFIKDNVSYIENNDMFKFSFDKLWIQNVTREALFRTG